MIDDSCSDKQNRTAEPAQTERFEAKEKRATSRINADIDVKRFSFVSDESGNRLLFPDARAAAIEGVAGTLRYGASACTCAALEGCLGMLRWKTAAATIDAPWLRDETGRYEVAATAIDHPHGLMLVRGGEDERGNRLEIVAPEATFSDLRITVNGPFRRAPRSDTEAATPTPDPGRLRFLDSLAGHLYAVLKARFDLPVLGERTIDQELRLPIQGGAIDFRALEDSLHWLGGAFLDIAHESDQLKVRWKIPLVGPAHDLVTWPLDAEAATLAESGRVPVRSLAAPHVVPNDDASEKKPKRKTLSAIALEHIDIGLSLAALPHLDVGTGFIAFGDSAPAGRLSGTISGELADQGHGILKGALSDVETTVKDLRFGPVEVTADRVCFEGLDQLELTFDGFQPTRLTMFVKRATATNLSIAVQTR